jgi:hypothetical protein
VSTVYIRLSFRLNYKLNFINTLLSFIGLFLHNFNSWLQTYYVFFCKRKRMWPWGNFSASFIHGCHPWLYRPLILYCIMSFTNICSTQRRKGKILLDNLWYMFVIFRGLWRNLHSIQEPQTKVSCDHDQIGLVTHPGYPDPDESGSQQKENPEQDKTPVNPEPS